MFHLFKHSKGKLKGKFDFAFISKGQYIVGSQQGYENKSDCYKAIRTMRKYFWGGVSSVGIYIQDDTETPSALYRMFMNGKPFKRIKKPSKPYTPNSKK